jgi:hypothetical protein
MPRKKEDILKDSSYVPFILDKATIEKNFVLDTSCSRSTNNSVMFLHNLARSRELLLIKCVSIVAAVKYSHLSD